MSYGLYITRADKFPVSGHRSECERQAIAFEEWEDLVRADPELAIDYSDRLTADELERLVDGSPELTGCRTADGFRSTKEQARRLKELAEGLKKGAPPDPEGGGCDTAEWKAHPKGEERCFWFDQGTISTKNPDVPTLDKMLQLADTLGACVRGDDGELSRRSGQRFECYEPDRGWLPLEEFHRGRPDWAPAIIREIAQRRSGTRPVL
jgi:hypothetical protein